MLFVFLLQPSPKQHTWTRIVSLFFWAAILLFPLYLQAATLSVSDSVTSTINDYECYTRSYAITEQGTIDSVTFEIHIDHTYRSDLDITLTSPAGTSVELTTDNGSSFDNLHVLFSDAASILITADYTSHDSSTTVERKPEEELNRLQNENITGAWTLEFCDDGRRDSGTYYASTLNIQYTLPNTPPNAADDTATTDEDQTVTINVLANDSDPDGDTLSISSVSAPANGSATINGDTIDYTPNPDYYGTDSFTYTITDGTDTATATVTVTVNGVNDAPLAVDDSADTEQETTVSIPVLSNDSDPDGDTLTISSVSAPANGSATINGDTIDYTPAVGFSGDDTFTYTVTDGTASSTATVTVSVVLVCHGCDCSLDDDTQNSTSPGITIPDLDHASSSVSTCLSGMSNGTIDNAQTDYYHFTTETESSFTISTDSPNGHEFHLQIEVNGTEVYPDTIAQNHSFTIDLSSNDLVVLYFKEHGDDLDEYEAQLDLTIRQVNHAPTALNDAAATTGAPVTIDVLANDSDPDGDTLHVIATTTPLLGSVTINSDDTVTYDPYDLFSCADSFDYTISDGNATATATVAIATTSTKPLGGDLQLFNRDDPSPDPAKVGDDVIFTLNTQNRIRASHRDIITEISYNQDVTIVDAYQYDPYTTYYGYVCDKRSGLLPAGEKITCTKNTDWGSITNYKDLKIIVQPSQPDLLVQNAIIYSTADNDPVCINNTATASVSVLPIAAVDDDYILYNEGNLSDNILANDYGSGLEIIRTDPEISSIPGLTLASNGDITFVSDGNTTHVSFQYTIKDGGGLEDNATVTITVLPHEGVCGKPHAFENRYTSYLPGDLVAIGNANICADEDRDGRCDADQRKRNDTSNIIYNNIYSSPELAASGEPGWLKNTSGAVLDLPDGAQVVWAGLYWHGEVWNFKTGDPALTTAAGIDTGKLGLEMMSREDRIQFKVPGEDYTELKADDHYYIYLKRWEYNSHTYGYGYADQMNGTGTDYNPDYALDFTRKIRYEEHYQGFKDVTAILQSVEAAQGSANGTYWVGDIQATLGMLWYPGVEAGWTLQVVYSLPNAQPRSIAITDGYVALYSSAHQGADYAAEFGCPTDAASTGVYAYTVDFDIPNILTPQKEGFTTDMTVFVTESDPEDSSTTEYLKVTKKDGTSYLVDGYNAWNYEIKKKDGSDNLDRTPDYIYPIGMTLKNYRMTDALSTEQNSTHVTFSTDTDRLILGVIGFATDMRAPELCYDYDIRIGDYIKLPSNDRNFTAQQWGDEDLQVKVLIRSKEADFDFENARLRLEFTPSDVFAYRSGASEISPEGINAYLPAIETDSSLGEIAIGHDFDSDGGILGPEESTYIKQKFEFIQSSFTGKFDIYVDGNVSYIPGQPPVGYHLSTAVDAEDPGYISRCPTNPIYDPIWGQFNIENAIADPTDEAKERYPLYTQVAGRPYDVRVVSYTDAVTGSFDTKQPIDATVELELIDVSPFDNNASAGYDSSCQEPIAASKGDFVTFNNQDTITVTPTDFTQYDNALTLHNAAFRIWILTKDDGNGGNELVYHTCSSADDSSCFDTLYANVYKNGDDNQTNYCESDCTASSGTTCYDCLRTYFSVPVCSRDNFTIRPEGFRVVLNDSNETNNSTPVNEISRNSSSVQEQAVAAGYRYQLKAEATRYGNQDIFGDPSYRSKAYYKIFDTSAAVNPLPTTAKTAGNQVILEFDDASTCADQNHTAYALTMQDSVTPSNTPSLVHTNVGKYLLWMNDANWTNVDQIKYPYKTIFDSDCATHPDLDKCSDCLVDDSSTPPTGEVGCTISSIISSNSYYKEIPLRFQPYSFDLSTIGFATKPADQSYLFMTDLDDPYYSTAASLSNPMAAIYEGNITALSKDGKVTSNFTDGCAASDLILRLDRETNASEADLKDQLGIEFQQYLQYGSDLLIQTDFDDTQQGEDANLTLAKAAFEDAVSPGTASIRIYTTFQKPSKEDIQDGSEGINPVRVNYLEVNATDTDANSNADMQIHTPQGAKSHDHNITFFYAKVTPNDKLYTTAEESVATPLNIIIYCDYGTAACDAFDLNNSISMAHESSNWYLATNLFSNTSDLGSSDLNVSYYSGKTPGDAHLELNGTMPQAKQLTGVGYELDGTQPDLLVSLPTDNPRPVTVEIRYTSSPWLNYDPAEEYYRVRFIPTPTKWTGHGKTGHVVDDDISTTQTKRVEW